MDARRLEASAGSDRDVLGLRRREWAVVLVSAVVGVVLGLGVRYVDSLPADVAYLGGLGKALFFVVGFVAVMIGIGQLTTGRRTVLLAAAPAVIAAVAAYPFGPTALPPVAVAGEARLSVAGEVAGTDAAGCTWAPGRQRIALVESSGRLATGDVYTLDVNLGDLTITLRAHGGRYVARGADAFTDVTGDAATVALELPLVQIDPSAPLDIPPQLLAAIDWRCDPPPP